MYMLTRRLVSLEGRRNDNLERNSTIQTDAFTDEQIKNRVD